MAPRADLIVDSKDKVKKMKKLIEEQKPMLVLYHASWCPHCVHYVGPSHEDSYPWQQICKRIHGKVVCVEVEADHMGLLDPEHSQIQGFPTLMYMKGGYKSEFAGNRNDGNAVEAFVMAQNGQTAGCGCGGRVGGAVPKKAPKKASSVKPKPASKPKTNSKPKSTSTSKSNSK